MRVFKFIILFILFGTNAYAQLGGLPGAFSRLGFGARGISMGNAMVSVTKGDVVGYYNPALSSFQEQHLVMLSYSFLSFDRTLNFVSYTKNFRIPKQEQGGAGVTFSWINAGVSNIDGRDIDGFKIGDYSVFENQFTFAPSIRVSEDLSFGIGFKFYYSKMFEGVTSTALGFDFGGLLKAGEKINIGIAVRDVKSRYEWNTNDLYGQYGNITKDQFPVLINIGASYLLPKDLGVASLEFQRSTKTTEVDSLEFVSTSNIVKMGVEVMPVTGINFRAGFDNVELNADDIFGGSRVMFGFGYQKDLKNFILGLDYSFVMEPYSNKPFQTLTAVFKVK